MRGWLYTLYRPCASLQDLDHLDRDLSDVLPTLINFCSEPKSWPKTQHQLLFSQTVFVLQKHTSWFFHKLFLFCKNARPPADFFTNYFYFAKNTKNTRWFFHKTFLFCKNTRTPADFSHNYFYFAKTQNHHLIFSNYFYFAKTQDHQLIFSQTIFILQKKQKIPGDFFTNYFYFAKTQKHQLIFSQSIFILQKTKTPADFFTKLFLFCLNPKTPADFSQNYFYFAKTQKHQLIFSQYFYLAKNTKTPADFFHKTILILLKHKNISWFFHKVFLFCKSTKTPTDFFSQNYFDFAKTQKHQLISQNYFYFALCFCQLLYPHLLVVLLSAPLCWMTPFRMAWVRSSQAFSDPIWFSLGNLNSLCLQTLTTIWSSPNEAWLRTPWWQILTGALAVVPKAYHPNPNIKPIAMGWSVL